MDAACACAGTSAGGGSGRGNPDLGGHDFGGHSADLHFGLGLAGASVVGLDQARLARFDQDVLDRNTEHAERNRAWFSSHGVLALSLMSAPGAGKTALLLRTLEALGDRSLLTVIAGDPQATVDAARFRGSGVAAVQINTGRGSHLDADMVGHALERLDVRDGGVLFIENVGGLITPPSFDLGEAHRILVVSVTEGDDRPFKYPEAFAAADVLVFNKTDLMPHVRFDLDKCAAAAREINPELVVLKVSAESGEGVEAWCGWIAERRRSPRVETAAAG
ncbi:MAG: hydrogenase nickel incorporation protein HypB [Alphaproteobacteria bacterium]|nr:hydrogenase nickel incorporation protein HypB [Alphaproteobacteria bacterium]